MAVITDRDARPIGLLRWGWHQIALEEYIDDHMDTMRNVIHRKAPFGEHFQQLDSSWLEFRHLNHGK